MTGADLLARTLQVWGVPYIATLCGHGLDPFDAACRRTNLRLVDVRNEQSAGYMADACGRLTGQVGVCASSSGVAHVNALTGAVNAFFDGAPMLLITGSGPTRTIGSRHFQDLDHSAIARPICKYVAVIDRAERIPEQLHNAWTAAISGRPGPVQLTIPLDVLNADIDDSTAFVALNRPERPVASGALAAINEAVGALMTSSRPVLVAGSGVHYSQGEFALLRFAQAQSIPILTPIWDRGAVSRPTSVFVGVVGAATGGPEILQDADCVVVVGAAADYRLGYLREPVIKADARIIRIDADLSQLQQGTDAQIRLAGDPALILDQLSGALETAGRGPSTLWLLESRKRCEAFRTQRVAVKSVTAAELHALDIIDAVKAILTDETILIIDGGNIGQWVHQTMADRYPGHWLTCGASGVVGYGLPAAMTARLLYPNRPVILITGDGAFTFTIAELESAARQKLGFAVILADDEAWGITLTGHTRQFGHGITSELGPIAFDQVARGFGAGGVRIQNAEDLPLLIQRASVGDRPMVIHVPIVRSNPSDGIA